MANIIKFVNSYDRRAWGVATVVSEILGVPPLRIATVLGYYPKKSGYKSLEDAYAAYLAAIDLAKPYITREIELHLCARLGKTGAPRGVRDIHDSYGRIGTLRNPILKRLVEVTAEKKPADTPKAFQLVAGAYCSPEVNFFAARTLVSLVDSEKAEADPETISHAKSLVSCELYHHQRREMMVEGIKQKCLGPGGEAIISRDEFAAVAKPLFQEALNPSGQAAIIKLAAEIYARP